MGGATDMTWFTTSTRSSAMVSATPEEVWGALSDPDQLARMTPFLQDVRPQGTDHWVWEMNSLPVLGHSVSLSFTERMTFDEPHRIEFVHDPSAGPGDEGAGVEGWYALSQRSAGTLLETSMAITVDLPFPGLLRPAVCKAMTAVIVLMGQRFSHNLLDHLDAHPA